MKKKATAVRDLQPAPYNPRKITDAQLANLKRSMDRFGDLSGIVRNVQTGNLVGGHQRTKHFDKTWHIEKEAHKDNTGTVAIGYIDTPNGRWAYREVAWDESTEKAANIAANIAANAHGGEFDLVKTGDLLHDLDIAKFDLTILGFDPNMVEELLAANGEKETKDEDLEVAPGSVPARAKAGDIWILGEHRLMCGDSTKREDVQKLMAGAKAHMVFTDAPYGVSYQAKSGQFEVIEGDHKRDDEIYKLITGAMTRAAEVTTDSAAFYVWHASSTRAEFAQALKAAGLQECQYLIWVKHGIVLGHSDYHWAHEPCFYASKEGKKPAFYGDRAQNTVWRVSLKGAQGTAIVIGQGVVLRDGKGSHILVSTKLVKGKKVRTERLAAGGNALLYALGKEDTVWEVGHDRGYIHPTQKPTELARRAIGNSSTPEQIVLDLFGGSGSTLIACEALTRKGRLMELDPKYVDAIIARWERFTGQGAVREK